MEIKIGKRYRIIDWSLGVPQNAVTAEIAGHAGCFYTATLYKKGGEKMNGRFGVSSKQLTPLTPTWETLDEGDVLLDGEGERTVLGKAGKVFFLSSLDDPEVAVSVLYTLRELKGLFTIKEIEEEDDTVEVTIEEIAKLKGIPVEKVRIKEKDNC